MKEINLYECEMCKTRYFCADDATACEKKHSTVDHIGDCRYVSTQSDPTAIEIWFSDGSHRIYSR